MPLQTSGAISLSDIRGEFGGSVPDSLSEYYRGGGLVPDTPANAGIPTSGAISLSDFYGGDATVETVTLSGELIFAGASAPGTARAQLKIDNNGNVYKVINTGSPVQIDSSTDWLRPITGAPGTYQVRFTDVTGDPLDGTETAPVDVWHALSGGDFFVSQQVSGSGGKDTTFTAQLRKGTGAVIASASYTLNASLL